MHNTHLPHIAALLLMGLLAACSGGESKPDPRPEPEPDTNKAKQDTTTTDALGARPADDAKRDDARKPQQVMDFLGIKAGDTVLEIMAGTGWYSDQLARRVGKDGTLYVHNNTFVNKRFGDRLKERLDALNAPQAKPLVVDLGPDPITFPEDLDHVVIVRFYHDLYWMEGVDRAAFNQAVFKALKPGGVYGVIDYHAKAGQGASQAKTLHRVEASLLRKEIEAAGFTLDASSDLLQVKDDSRDWRVFERSDETDRFLFKFRKPKASTTPEPASDSATDES